MSETLSQLPTTSGQPALSDILPITRGYTGSATGTTYADTTAKLLSANGLVYAGDPRFGVKADGSTDDTTAWGAALTAAFNSSSWVVAPIGLSLVSALTVPAGVGILGRAPGSYSSSIGPLTTGTVIKGTIASAPAISLGQFSQLRGLQVNGSGSQPCVGITVGYADLFDVTCFSGSVGISTTLVGGASRLLHCRIHDCGTAGISAGLDLTATGCIITNCGIGVSLSNGSNGVRIIGGKIETSGTAGIQADGTAGSLRDLVVSGVGFDANAGNAILLRAVTGGAIHGCTFARSGVGQSGSPGNSSDAHVYLNNNNGVVVTGNASRTGATVTYVAPFYAVWDAGGNTNSTIVANGFAYHNNSATLAVLRQVRSIHPYVESRWTFEPVVLAVDSMASKPKPAL